MQLFRHICFCVNKPRNEALAGVFIFSPSSENIRAGSLKPLSLNLTKKLIFFVCNLTCLYESHHMMEPRDNGVMHVTPVPQLTFSSPVDREVT